MYAPTVNRIIIVLIITKKVYFTAERRKTSPFPNRVIYGDFEKPCYMTSFD